MTSRLLKSMVILFALLCIGGCADSETNSTEEMPNNDIGKISFTGRYYIDNSVLYSEDDTGKNQILSDAYSVQTVGDDVYALAYTNNTNTIYKITDNCKAEAQFHTDKMPEKAIINKYGCFYTIGNSLDFIEMNSNNDIPFDKIEGADDFTVTDNGVYWLKFTGNIDDGSEPFSDLNNLSISEELWYYSFDGNSNLVAELNDGYGSFLTRCYDNVVYRYNTGLYMADKDGSECIVENVMPTSIVVYDQMIYFSDLANGSLNRYSIKDGTLTKIDDYIEIVGINNNNLIDSSFNDIVLNQ